MARQGPFDVTIEVDGKTYAGSYTIEGRGPTALVEVVSQFGTKGRQAGNSGAEATARMTLGEQVAWFLQAQRRRNNENGEEQTE